MQLYLFAVELWPPPFGQLALVKSAILPILLWPFIFVTAVTVRLYSGSKSGKISNQ